MDVRLSEVRVEIESGTVSPQALATLFNVASDAEHARDLSTLEQTLALAHAIADEAAENLREEAERLATICGQSLASVRERVEATQRCEPTEGPTICPECGNEVAAEALRCRRCGHRFI
jgi:hypothetical protein